MTELLAYISSLQRLAGVAPKQPLPLAAAGPAAAVAGAAAAGHVALEAPLVAAGVDGPADSEDELSEEAEAPTAAPAKRRRGAART